MSYKPKDKVDAVLWLWSDIASFAKNEQLNTLKHISTWLNPNGILIIETLLHTLTTLNASIAYGQEYKVESEYGIAYGYIPSCEEISHYAKSLGYTKIQHKRYFTATGRERILNILSC